LWKQAGLPAELHIYEAGAHGFRLRHNNDDLPVDRWTDRLVDWMDSHGLIDRLSAPRA
jgi:hypothetical protein